MPSYVETVGYRRFRSLPPGPGVGPFAALMERWRLDLGVSNRAFARLLGRSQPEWSLVQRGVRPVSRATAAAVLSRADEPWRSAFKQAYLDELTASGTGAGAPHGARDPDTSTSAQKAG